MKRSLLMGVAVLTLSLAIGAPKTAYAFRGGSAGGGFHAGGRNEEGAGAPAAQGPRAATGTLVAARG
ncbi:hypothetical protein RZS28_07190 [Methylocapsa polymorpha]|uniref:Uncharacterized protein n=1 Tax=Methylocapsa polymorpha TaxID=3080828 RepID=A0ABZ0HUW3_9HYPH|nr:hypothetical protein RZS28_07190 [Methylocapsa sp. RX1]